MNRRHVAMLAIAAALAALAAPAHACSLPQKMPTVVEMAGKADHLFVAAVRQLKHDDMHLAMPYEVTVIETVKGSATGTLQFYSLTSSAACGFILADGVYLVGATDQQLKAAKGEARAQYASQAARYGAQLNVFGVHERHASAGAAAEAARKHLAGGE